MPFSLLVIFLTECLLQFFRIGSLINYCFLTILYITYLLVSLVALDLIIDHFSSQDKLAPRVLECVFLDYSRLQKGYKCFCPSTRLLMLHFLSHLISSLYHLLLHLSQRFYRSLSFAISSEPSPPPPFQLYEQCHHPLVRPPDAPTTSSQVIFEGPDSYLLPMSSRSAAPSLIASNQMELRRGDRLTRNPHLIYYFLSYHRLSLQYLYFKFICFLTS